MLGKPGDLKTTGHKILKSEDSDPSSLTLSPWPLKAFQFLTPVEYISANWYHAVFFLNTQHVISADLDEVKEYFSEQNVSTVLPSWIRLSMQ